MGENRSAGPLLERGDEIAAIERAIDDAKGGAGRVLFFEGAAGIGKTRLLWALRPPAAERGFRTFGARCDELEDSIAFGLAAQLLTPPLQSANAKEREALLDGAAALAAPLLVGVAGEPGDVLPPVGDPSQALLRGLTWLVTNLSAGGPIALLIDDAHWADPESLRWLNHLEKRIAELPVVIAATVRRGEVPAAEQILRRLAATESTGILVPDPLSEAATTELLGRRLEATPSRELVTSAQAVTGGNPLLVDALGIELLAQKAGTGTRAAELAGRLVPESIVRTVLLRLRRLPEPARAAAEALTILGDAPASTVIAMAGLDSADGENAIEALEGAELVEAGATLRFAHPIIRSTIYEQISPRRRHRRHVEAAKLLHAAGEQPERVAPHLIAAGDVELDGGAEILVEAGRRVYAFGAPEATVRYLLRALEMNPEAGMRAEIQLQLGAAAIRALDGGAVKHLEEAVAGTTDESKRRAALMELARAQLSVLDLDSAADTFELALEISEGDRELELSATAELASAELNLHRFDRAVERIAVHRDELAGESPAERKLLAVAAFAAAQRNEPAELVLELAERALGEGQLLAEQSCASVIVLEVLMALVLVEGDALVEEALESAIADSRERGWPIGFAMASTIRSWVSLRRGDIAAAERDARAADDIRILHGATPLDPFVTAYLAWILVEQDRPDEAAALIGERCPAEIPDAAVFQLSMLARGEIRIAAGDRDAGIDDVLLVGERELRYGGLTPLGMSWRSTAAAALAGRGEDERARTLAADELQLAQAGGTDRAIGIALRGLALVGDDGEAIAELERSIEHLRRSGARLELSRSLTELGAATRRSRRSRDAREPLREAIELAVECGSALAERRASEELGATGEHQRTMESDGVEALTPSELRVARMAAAGRSNREIAEDLFVTPRTVEAHLTSGYRKLGIRNRRGLADALVATAPAEP